MLARQDWSGLRKLIALKAAYGDGGGLPSEYEKADYLVAGAAYMDTGVSGANDDLVIEFDVMPISFATYASFIGNFVDSESNVWRMFFSSANNLPMYVCTNTRAGRDETTNILASQAIGKKMSVVMKYCDVTITIDGTPNQITFDTANGAENQSTILISKTGANQSREGVPARWWYVKIWSGDALIRDYIPCTRKSDSKAGFYDRVNKTFNPSIGSVDFVSGMDN